MTIVPFKPVEVGAAYPVETNRVLARARALGLKCVAVVGYDAEGNLELLSTEGDGDTHLLLARGQAFLAE